MSSIAGDAVRSAVNSRSVLLAWLLLLANSSWASAQQISPANCQSQQVVPPPPQVAYYQIKGVTGATNLPQGTTLVYFTVRFQSMVNNAWKDQFYTQAQVPTGNSSTVSYDTGWLNFSPAVGEQWRISVNGYYVQGGQENTFQGIGSQPITPRP